MKYVECADGSQALADDMPPSTRAFLLLVEHANQRRDDGLPLPCRAASAYGIAAPSAARRAPTVGR